jgi:hypothetical protein
MSLPYTYEKDESWIYEKDGEGIRYVLGEKGSKILICVGINPSSATPEKLDPTLTRVQKRAQNSGYDGWIMFNIYPQRDKNPKKLHKNMDNTLHEKNLDVIKNVLDNVQELNVWCAWGTPIEKKKYLKNCLKGFYDLTHDKKINWLCAGQTQKGHPRHPLYLKSDLELVEFKIKEYI